ncbi:hypothetical protein GBA52_005421 [Prunus armeniaca]|nr:hypothetical protein GBA52_005421 [Prunus armeniaca]
MDPSLLLLYGLTLTFTKVPTNLPSSKNPSDVGLLPYKEIFRRIARTAGRLAGRAIGYVQLARGQFENVMQQSQARQVHKELQDALAQLESIRYEVRSISLMNPGPLTRKLMDNPQDLAPTENVEGSDIVLEAILEAEVARNAKDFFSQPANQIQ